MMTYDQFISSTLNLYEFKEYERALNALETEMDQFPEQVQILIYAGIFV